MCDDVTPFVESVYQQILADSSAATRKAADKSYFSLADGVIQARRSPPPLAACARAALSPNDEHPIFDERCLVLAC